MGLGNPLMADEGVGVHLIRLLAERAAAYPEVDFVDAGTGGMTVLHLIAGRRKAIFIDCAFMDEPPGSIRRFRPEDVRSRKVLAHQSLHEADLLHILEMARTLGPSPEEVVLFGIQPAVVEVGQRLSPTLAGRMDHYLSVVAKDFPV